MQEGTRIGGPTLGEGNLISGNKNQGIWLVASPGALIQGNSIGTDALGAATIPNENRGLWLAGSSNTVVGGTAPAARNLISGNGGEGIRVEDASNNTIQGNYIGTDLSGVKPLGNAGNGIFITSASQTNLIGDGQAGAGNAIAYNGGDGISIAGEPAQSNSASTMHLLSGNSIHSNGGAGIDLNDDGVTPNDSGDADSGANFSQNYPVLSSAVFSAGHIRIQGTLNTDANTPVHIEFFGNGLADPSGFGEGRHFLGTTNVTTDASGNASFDVDVPFITGSQKVTATASADLGTSEFSSAIQISDAPSQLLNIATRLRVQGGDNVLIGGFIVTGTDPKKVVIRGMGPSLAQFFNGTLADPTLELFQGNTSLGSSNDWKESQAEIEATGIPPSHDKESAIVRTLAPGSYTAVLQGNGGSTGIGVVEVYDLDQGANSKLANIASRGFVEAGDNIMIGGLIVGPGGGASTKGVVRAIGPTLSNFGIAGTLQDPTLDLVNANGGVIRTNNNWNDSQETEIAATGLQPGDFRESALIEVLAPGNYTAIVRGSGNTTGVGLVEVYNLE